MTRVHNRVGHYMKDSMVKSQFEALEPPSEDEKDVIDVDVARDIREVQILALDWVDRVLAADANVAVQKA